MFKHDINNDNRIRYTTYTAGAIESVSAKEMKNWREEIKEYISCPDVLVYDPVEQESQKVGKPSIETVRYISGLKQSGHYDLFYTEMWKIWFGNINFNTDLMHLLVALRMKKHIDGNRPRDLKFWGDAEAVVRSDFVIVYLPKDTKTVGTIYEIVFAFLFSIPVYLILPDVSKTDTNSSLLFGVQLSGGEVFYSIKECCDFIKNKYSLKIEEKK